MAPSNARMPQAPEDGLCGLCGLCGAGRSRVLVPASLHESLQRPGKRDKGKAFAQADCRSTLSLTPPGP